MPLVSIVLAIYKPNMEWLKAQLDSLNQQTYPNIELLICDDCPQSPFDTTILNCITHFKYTVYYNENNIGSTKTFERLTKLANGDYIAYCDQDDVWAYDKIETLVKLDGVLCFSNMSYIDETGKKIRSTNHKIPKQLTERLIMRNFVTGCTMLIDSRVAKSAMPFPQNFYHDHWLAFYASMHGEFSFASQNLVSYRRHGTNQTGFMKDILTKEDYFRERILSLEDKLNTISKRLHADEILCYVKKISLWVDARKSWWINHDLKSLMPLLKDISVDKKLVLCEVIAALMPNWLFKSMMRML